MGEKITIDDAILSSPRVISTNFPWLWPYFMADERGFGQLQSNEVVIAGIRFSAASEYNEFELWGKSNDPVAETHLYYLVQREHSLLFLDKISTPKREEIWKELVSYEDHWEEERLDSEERQRVVKYAIDMAVRLHNGDVDRDSLSWVVYGGWSGESKRDWRRNDTVKDLELAARLMRERVVDVRLSLKNLPEYDRLKQLQAETTELAQTLMGKTADPDYEDRNRERCKQELDVAKSALDKSPEDWEIRTHYALCAHQYALSCGKTHEEAGRVLTAAMQGK